MSVSRVSSRRRFDAAFKPHVAQLVRDQHLSVRQVCDDLDVDDSNVRRWVAQLDACTRYQSVLET